MMSVLNSISDKLSSVGSVIVDRLSEFISDFFENPLAAIIDLIRDVFDVVFSLADNIINPLKSFLEWLFIPDTTQIEAKFQEIRSKYGFVDSVIETGEALGGVFSRSTMADQTPPVIYIDFGAAETDYSWGGKMKVLDLSWYSRYKPTVDTVLGAIMWAFFIWRVYVRLPSIISGGSGLVKLDTRSGGRDDI